MKKDEIYYGINETARKLGMGRDLLIKEFKAGKIKGTRHGCRIKFSRAQIEEYNQCRIIDNAAPCMDDYVAEHITTIPGVGPDKS